MEFICDCGQKFEAKGKNARYCPECARERKRYQDQRSWEKRAHKKRREKNASEQEITKRLENWQMKDLGISLKYYLIWKDVRKDYYSAWLKCAIEKERKRLGSI